MVVVVAVPVGLGALLRWQERAADAYAARLLGTGAYLAALPAGAGGGGGGGLFATHPPWRVRRGRLCGGCEDSDGRG